MKEPPVIRFVTKQLDTGLSKMPDNVTERLKAARHVAIQKRKVVSEARFAGLAGWLHFDLLTQRTLAKTAMALLIAGGFSIWHADRYISQTAEIDSELLSDDLPIDALTDKGFDAWLNSSEGH